MPAAEFDQHKHQRPLSSTRLSSKAEHSLPGCCRQESKEDATGGKCRIVLAACFGAVCTASNTPKQFHIFSFSQQHPSLSTCDTVLQGVPHMTTFSLGNQKAPCHLTFCISAAVQVVVTPLGSQKGLGAIGQINKVPNGYFRNYLQPNKLASPATPGILK